jgi:DNA-binding CsgD family transcriptional regulator
MKLSIREKEILDLLIQGKLNKEIASLLFISEETVKKHLKNVYRKLGVRNRVEATLKTYKFR